VQDNGRYHGFVAKERVENCFPLSLDSLPGPSSSPWIVLFQINVEIGAGGRSESAPYSMVVKRSERRLEVRLRKLSYPNSFFRDWVAIDSRRRGGYAEYLVCPACRHSVRALFLPVDAEEEEFRCRACHDLAYSSQFRHKSLFERLVIRDRESGRRRVRLSRALEDPDNSGLSALRAAFRSPDDKAIEAFVRGPGRSHSERAPAKRKRGRPKKRKRTYSRRPYDKKRCRPNEAFCVRCKLAREIIGPVQTKFRNGRPAIMGSCAGCGARVWRATKKGN
jgi:hypothetical protein